MVAKVDFWRSGSTGWRRMQNYDTLISVCIEIPHRYDYYCPWFTLGDFECRQALEVEISSCEVVADTKQDLNPLRYVSMF